VVGGVEVAEAGGGALELQVHLGVPRPSLFAARAQAVAVEMPRDEEYTWLADVDNDGRQDVVMHLPSASGPHRVTMLIAR